MLHFTCALGFAHGMDVGQKLKKLYTGLGHWKKIMGQWIQHESVKRVVQFHIEIVNEHLELMNCIPF